MSTGRTVTVDIETYSPEDIGAVGAYKYAQHEEFAVLLLSWSDGETTHTIDLTAGQSLEQCRGWLFSPGTTKRAHNAAFEWWCLSEHFGLTEQQRRDWLQQWEDSMVQALYCGLPAKLETLGKALQMPEDKAKLRTGKALISYFCKPCKQTKANGMRTRNLPADAPDKWKLFVEYNAQDVVAEEANDRALAAFPVPESIWQEWREDVWANACGIQVDTVLVNKALQMAAEADERMLDEARLLTGLANPNSAAQLGDWLAGRGVTPDNLQRATVDAMAEDESLPEDVRRVLSLRLMLGKTSCSKYLTLAEATGADGRIRGTLQFYGAARTGRWAGRLVQVQNLPRTYIKAGAPQRETREIIKTGTVEDIEMLYGDVKDTLSQMIRTALIPAPGKVFVDADFSAIEARLIAWLAGEEWVLDVFRTTGKIYEATAAKMFGIPVETIKKGNPNYSYRQRGKVATLALGYQGGVGAMRRMDVSGALAALPDSDIKDMVNRWRRQNPHIVQLWADIQEAAVDTIAHKTVHQTHGITFAMEASAACPFAFMSIKLPSGRKLYYADPAVTDDGRITYMEQGLTGWEQSESYGGKLTENVIQAIGRDCLAYALGNLRAAGLNVVFSIHDEVVVEADDGDPDATLDTVEKTMAMVPPWAEGLPLNADGWHGYYFTKD